MYSVLTLHVRVQLVSEEQKAAVGSRTVSWLQAYSPLSTPLDTGCCCLGKNPSLQGTRRESLPGAAGADLS